MTHAVDVVRAAVLKVVNQDINRAQAVSHPEGMTVPKTSTDPTDRIPHLRTIAMPRDANASGAIFGGWTLSQMDLAGATFAARCSGGRVATISIDAMKFLHPITVGDDVSCYCTLEQKSQHSIAVKIETWSASREGEKAEKVTEGVFTYVALDDNGKPREVS